MVFWQSFKERESAFIPKCMLKYAVYRIKIRLAQAQKLHREKFSFPSSLFHSLDFIRFTIRTDYFRKQAINQIGCR